MTKIALTAAALLGLITTADAAPRSYHSSICNVTMKMDDGRWRTFLNGCVMGRDYGTNMTAVKMGKALLVIQRDPDEYGIAKLYAITSDGTTTFMGTATANGGCWVGRTVRFCAQ